MKKAKTAQVQIIKLDNNSKFGYIFSKKIETS